MTRLTAAAAPLILIPACAAPPPEAADTNPPEPIAVREQPNAPAPPDESPPDASPSDTPAPPDATPLQIVDAVPISGEEPVDLRHYRPDWWFTPGQRTDAVATMADNANLRAATREAASTGIDRLDRLLGSPPTSRITRTESVRLPDGTYRAFFFAAAGEAGGGGS